jgi:hypothetical protein
MGSQFLGLILLILAVSSGLYFATNYSDLISLTIEVPDFFQPTQVTTENYFATAPEPVETVLESRSPLEIGAVLQRTSFTPYAELVIYSNIGFGEVINVTGWTIKGNNGSFAIPKAQEIYSFGDTERDIVLRSSHQLHIYSGISPRGNFRINKCMGYFSQFNSFVPDIPRACPRPNRPEISNLSGACQEYILSLSACQVPASNPPVPVNDSSCHQCLRKINYVGCVEKYRNDSDFLSNEWRVWVGEQLDVLDPIHDRVQLIDQTGKVADEYSY